MLTTIKWDGHQITKPGMYSAIPLDTYHDPQICDGPSISSSGLRKIIRQSPAHFYCEWPGNPERVVKPDKRNLVLGRAVHHLFLGEKFFSALFAVEPDEYPIDASGIGMKPWNNNANHCRAWQAEQAKAGRYVMKPADAEAIRGMSAELGKHTIIRDVGILNGMIERSLFWKDRATGIWLKSRPDSVPSDSGDFVDLKTTISVQWIDLMRAISDFGYHQQGALVTQAARQVLNIPNPTFTLVFVESRPPHCPRIVTIDQRDLELGDRLNRTAIDTFVRCLKSGHWPGPGGEREDAEMIGLSDHDRKYDERLSQQGI